MLRTTRYIVVLGLAVLLASVWLFSETAVYSIPAGPHGFYGKVTDSNNNLIGAGASIEARIGNVHFAQSVDSATDTSTQTTVTHAASDGLNFGVLTNFQVCGDDVATTAKEGGTKVDSITFYVGGVTATIIEIDDTTTSRSTILWATMGSTKLHLRIPSLAATQAAAATASTAACSEQAAATPTPSPVPTVTPTPAPVVAAAATATPAPAAAAVVVVPTASPTPSPSPTPVTTEQLQTLTVAQQLDTLDLLTVDQQANLIDDLVDADVDAGASLIQGLVTKNADDAAEILSAMGSEEVATIFASEKLDVGAAAAVLGSGNMSADKAAAILQQETLGADRAASILSSDEISVLKAAQILNSVNIDAGKGAAILNSANMDADRGAAILNSVNIDADKGAAILNSANIDADKGAAILNSVNIDADKGAAILNSANIDADKGAAILNSANIDADKGAAILNSANIDADKGAAILNSANMDADKGAELLASTQLDAGKAADILSSNQIDATKAAAIFDQPTLTAARSAAILGEVEKTKAGAILEAVSNSKVEGIVANMPEAKLVERLPEMSAGKLHTLSPAVLFDNLPSVPTEAIAREFAPVVDASCAPPESTQESAERVVYAVCDTVESAWAKLVGSPAPIDSILGKFTTVRSGIQIGIEEIESLPAAAPQFSADRFLNSFFNINIEGAEEGDLSAIHTTMFVEKSWIQANDIHKWSIAFNRFDDELGAWVPVAAKRVRETTDRIYYTGVVPSFSTFAITGGTAPVTPQFTVRSPSDRPFIQRAGPQTTVAAEITNDGTELLHYVANLWINDTIDRTMLIRVEPGETKQFEFPAFTMDPGDYGVRVERLLGSFNILAPTPTLTPAPAVTVTAPPTPTFTPVPATPTLTPAPPTPTALPAPVTVPPTPTLTPVPPTPTLTPAPPTPTALPMPVTAPALTPAAPTPTALPVPTLTPAPPIEEKDEEGGISLLLITIIGIIVIIPGAGAVYFYLRQQGQLPPRMPGAPGSRRESGLGPPIDPFSPSDSDEGTRGRP